MITAWLLFPLVALAVFVGCGLLVERLSGVRLAGTILPSLGLALVIVAATLTTLTSATAKLTTALVVALAVAGYASSIGRVRNLRPEPIALVLGLSLFAVFAAPVVLSGNASFLGYFVLDDSAIHFALIDQLLSHGRDLSAIHNSTLLPTLHAYLTSAYPIGAQAAVGALRPLVAQNIAWIFQPYLAVVMVLGGLAIYQLLSGVVRSRRLAALCAFTAAQAGLVYAYYLEGSIKELATTWLITLVVVLVIENLGRELSVRKLAPLAIVTVAAFDVLDLAIVPWLGVPLLVFAVLVVWRSRRLVRGLSRRRLGLLVAGGAVGVGLLASPIIATGETSFNVLSNQLTKHGDLGNLTHPVSKWELLGIWPSGDYRIPVNGYAHQIPGGALITALLIALAVLSALLGIVWALRRQALGPLLLISGSGLAAIYLLSRASPYAAAKVLMICSVAVVVTVMLGPAAVADVGPRFLRSSRAAAVSAWTLALVLAGGVLWTNVDAYAGARLAPRQEYAELEAIGSRFAGKGPAFYNLGDEFALHFLRSELPTVPAFGAPAVRSGAPVRVTFQQSRAPWDLDELDRSYVQQFPLLVLGRSPLGSRPPANYQLAFRGRYYEVWRRTPTPLVVEHLPLGGAFDPAAVPRCADVLTLARRAARAGDRLAYSTQPVPIPLLATQLRYQEGSALVSASSLRAELPGEEAAVLLHQPGVVVGSVPIPRAGDYEVWLNGSFSRQVVIRLDGRRIGSASYEIGPPGQYLFMGTAELAAGTHRLSIVLPNESLAPGELARNQALRSILLTRAPESEPVWEVQPTHARALCGQALDWIEIVR